MILFSFAQRPITGEPWIVVDAARWVMRAGLNGTFGLWLCEQRRRKGSREWGDDGPYVGVWLAPWRVGYSYVEYEGSHESIGLGFVRVDWQVGFMEPVPEAIRRVVNAMCDRVIAAGVAR